MNRRGYLTTEFLATAAVSAGTVIASAANWLPPRYAAMASGLAVSLYSVSRGLAKLTLPPPGNPPPPAPPA